MERKSLFSEILSTATRYFLILVILVAVGICCSGIRVVESGNVAVILRCGKLVGDTPGEQVHEPGLLLAFPYIIDEVIMVPTSSVIEQSVTTHYTPNTESATTQYVITGDQNIATLSASVKYVISDPVAYALYVSDVPSVINACVSNAMLTEAAGTDVDELLTTGKDSYIHAVLQRASDKLNQSGIGVTLTTIELTNVSVAMEVREKYNNVNAATVDAATLLEAAENYNATVIPSAQEQATQLITQATADKATAIADATTALAEFWGMVEEYKTSPEALRTRVYSEKITQLLQTIGAVKVVQEGETNIFIDP